MISKFFIERPRFAVVLSILFLLAGGIALLTLPVAQYPQIAPSQISISATYPGADAETVMNTVVQPIETNLNGVKRMIYFSSTATDSGTAQITATFDIGTDGDLNTVNTQNRVNWTANLPTEVSQQGITVKERSPNMLLALSLVSPNGTYDDLALSNFMSVYIKDRLAQIPGVGDVVQFGEKKFSMRIWLDPDRMASFGVGVDDVKNAIQAQNIQVSAGSLGEAPTDGKQMMRYAIGTQGRLSSKEEFENILVKVLDDGSKITIRNIADVEEGAENYLSDVRSFGRDAASGTSDDAVRSEQHAAVLAVYQLPDANGLQIAEQVMKTMNELKRDLFPEDMDFRIQYDSTKFISSSIAEVRDTLIEAVLLVILVTFLFLQDWRATLVPTIAIPVSLIGTFAFLSVIGYSINLITLFGLILAIGIVVDDAIVVIENVNRLMNDEGLSPKEAAIKSMEQVTAPVVATTSVLLAMFVPVCFLPGITGVIYRQFGVTISIAVLISMVNALTLSPALSAVLLRPAAPQESRKGFFPFRLLDRFFHRFNQGFDACTSGYMFLVRKLIRICFPVVGAVLLLLFLSARLFSSLPTGFVPDEDQGSLLVNVQLPDAASLARTKAAMEKIGERMAKIPEIRSFMSVSGYNILTGVSSSNNGFILIDMIPWEERPDKTQSDVMGEFMRRCADVSECRIMPFGMPSVPGIGTTGGFSFILKDVAGTRSPQELQEIAEAVCREATNSPEIESAFTTFRATFPQIRIDVDRQKALKLGVPLSAVNDALKSLFGYAYVNDYNKFGKTYRVEIQAKSGFRDEIDDLRAFKVRSETTGETVPLGTLADISVRFVPQYVQHYKMSSSVAISGSQKKGFSSGQAMARMERIAKEILPSGMTFEWTDMSYQEKLAGNQIFVIFALALLFIYLFLVAQYESFMIPLAVVASVPIALFGALVSLALLGIDNNIYAQVGFVLLFGIACKTAILIVEFAKECHDKHGLPVVEAAERAAKLRFRAVLMTAVSFLLGTWPLVVAFGASSVSRRSLGTAVFGGMLVSVVIGTLCVPALYAAVQRTIDGASALPKLAKGIFAWKKAKKS